VEALVIVSLSPVRGALAMAYHSWREILLLDRLGGETTAPCLWTKVNPAVSVMPVTTGGVPPAPVGLLSVVTYTMMTSGELFVVREAEHVVVK
jgi:hypothetical protein